MPVTKGELGETFGSRGRSMLWLLQKSRKGPLSPRRIRFSRLLVESCEKTSSALPQDRVGLTEISWDLKYGFSVGCLWVKWIES